MTDGLRLLLDVSVWDKFMDINNYYSDCGCDKTKDLMFEVFINISEGEGKKIAAITPEIYEVLKTKYEKRKCFYEWIDKTDIIPSAKIPTRVIMDGVEAYLSSMINLLINKHLENDSENLFLVIENPIVRNIIEGVSNYYSIKIEIMDSNGAYDLLKKHGYIKKDEKIIPKNKNT